MHYRLKGFEGKRRGGRPFISSTSDTVQLVRGRLVDAFHQAADRKGWCALVIGCFSSKTRTSLKTQLLFYVLEHFNFPGFSLPESCSQTGKEQFAFLHFHHL